jgi:transposase
MIMGQSQAKVYLVTGYTDMRKAIGGLSVMVQAQLELDPFSGHLFVFCNRKQNIIKILYWDLNGFCLWQKKLEKHTFKWPTSRKDVLYLQKRQLIWLLDGLDLCEIKGHNELEYSTLF